MGNAQMKLNDSNKNVLIDEPLLQTFKKHVTIIDHAVTGLARGIDALQSTCELFLQQNPESTAEHSQDSATSRGAVILIIQKINECICENKAVTLQSIKNFFSFIMKTGEDYIENADDAFSALSVSKYKFHFEDEIQHDWFTEFYNKRLEFYRKELELLQINNDLQKEEIETLQKKQSFYDIDFFQSITRDLNDPKNQKKEQTEESSSEAEYKNVLKSSVTEPRTSKCHNEKENKDQFFKEESGIEEGNNTTLAKEDLALMKEKISQLQEQIQTLEEDKLRMGTELLRRDELIKQFTTRKVKVQIFRRLLLASADVAHNDFCDRLQNKFSEIDAKLEVTTCKFATKVKHDIPLLVCTNHCYTRRRNGVIESAIAGFDHCENKAVLVFHQTEEKDLPYEISQYDNNTKCEIFHFGYKGSLYKSDMNEICIDGVTAFIEKFGEMQQTI